MTELEKMIAGELYNPADDELVKMRQKAHRLCTQFNQTFETDEETRCAILRDLLAEFDEEEYAKEIKAFMQTCYKPFDDGHASERIVSVFKEVMRI